MDRRERYDNPTVALRAALRGWQTQIWTALPAIFQAAGKGVQTANVQPAIQAELRDQAGNWTAVTMPLCVDCPILFPGGGGFQLTFPLAAGDEGLLVFSARCIDAWWQSGGIQPQAEIRMHDLSDGFFIPGQLSQAKVPSGGYSATNAQLKTASGTVLFDLTPAKITINANVDIVGALTATGNVTAGKGGVDQVTLQGHLHGGVSTGGGSTAAPTAGT
jgi:hypothetical protein